MIIKAFDDVLKWHNQLNALESVEKLQQQKRVILKNLSLLRELAKEIKLIVKDSNRLTMHLAEMRQLVNIPYGERLPELVRYRGIITELEQKYGVNSSDAAIGNRLVILDKFSLRNYVVFSQPVIRFGRDEDNDVILKSSWVSGLHCILDCTNGKLRDNGSTNGTYINGKSERITEKPLSEIDYFDIGRQMVFSIELIHKGYYLKLQRIQDNKLLESPELKDYVQSLMNTEFIYLEPNGGFTINKLSGNIDEPETPPDEQIRVEYSNNSFFFTDSESGKIHQKLSGENVGLSNRFSLNLL